ncbi:MAG: phosphonate ABC transporter ATP-binding protein [Planctomycetota bacterium]
MSTVPASRDFTLSNVTVRYDSVVAIDNVSVRVEAGSRVGLVGPSGAGKTSLLRLLNGTIRPTSGAVRVGEATLSDLSAQELREIRERIGFIHQDLGLVRNIRAIQNVLAGRLGRRTFLGALRSFLFPNRTESREVFALLDRVGIADKIYERTDHLSGGEQQRVAVARALYQEPIAILADEPVASVDPARARDLVTLLRDISKERGLTLVMSLHNLELAKEFFPRLIGLRNGRVAFDAPTESITPEQVAELYTLEENVKLEPQRPSPHETPDERTPEELSP